MQHLHSMLLDLAISSSNIPDKISSLADLPPSSAISRYLKALESDVKAGHLKKQLGKWILEDRSKDKDFSYRLTGKDSKLVLHGFMFLVHAIKGDSENPTNNITHEVHLHCFHSNQVERLCFKVLNASYDPSGCSRAARNKP